MIAILGEEYVCVEINKLKKFTYLEIIISANEISKKERIKRIY